MLSLPKQFHRAVARHPNGVAELLRRLSMTFLLTGASLAAHAQRPPVPRVYTYVEQMPQLPGGGGTAAIWGEVMKRFRLLPGRAEPSCYRVVAYFEVGPVGAVQRARIVRASGSALVDSFLLAAVRSLPPLRPGYQQGRPVTVGLTIPCNIATQ